MKPVKAFPRNSMTRERLVTLIYFQLKGMSWKTDWDDFVDEFDNRHDNRGFKLHRGDDDIKFKLRLCRDLCENYIAQCLFVWICLGLIQVSAFFTHDSVIQRLLTYEHYTKTWQLAATSDKMMYKTTDSQHLPLIKEVIECVIKIIAQ